MLGQAPSERPLEVELRSAFAEYTTLPERRNELRLTLTSYESSCQSFRLPLAEELAVVVTVATPPGQPPAAGRFDWAGHEAHGGSPDQPQRAYALPFVRRGSAAFEFRPGGGIELSELALNEGGAIRGLLGFEFAGDAAHPAQALKGSFSGRVCRVLGASGPADD
jgi:hypothetical protein